MGQVIQQQVPCCGCDGVPRPAVCRKGLSAVNLLFYKGIGSSFKIDQNLYWYRSGLTDCSTTLARTSTRMRRLLRQQPEAACSSLRSCALMASDRIVFWCNAVQVSSRVIWVCATLSAYFCRRSRSCTSFRLWGDCGSCACLDCMIC